MKQHVLFVVILHTRKIWLMSFTLICTSSCQWFFFGSAIANVFKSAVALTESKYFLAILYWVLGR